jgi:ferric-dicitrate binding protein FerR (iron transport regulator)
VKDDVNDIREIMTKYFAGESSAAEEKVLHQWRQESSTNEAEFTKSRKLFDAATHHYSKAGVPEIDVEKEWGVFLKKVDESKPVMPMHSNRSTGLWMKIAASLLLLILCGAVIYFYSTKPETLTFQTAAATKTIELPDGSSVILNRNSQLSYDSDFGDGHRKLKLNGEAFFDVDKNPALPFVISARNTTIEVLGTSFNVLAYDSLEQVEVVVKTGVVRLSVPELKKSVELVAGKKGSYQPLESKVGEQTNDDINYQSWNTQQLSFNETHLTSVIEAINRTYHSNIVLVGPISDSCLLTVSFDNQTLDAVLNVLENTLNLTYQRSGNRIEITSAGC